MSKWVNDYKADESDLTMTWSTYTEFTLTELHEGVMKAVEAKADVGKYTNVLYYLTHLLRLSVADNIVGSNDASKIRNCYTMGLQGIISGIKHSDKNVVDADFKSFNMSMFNTNYIISRPNSANWRSAESIENSLASQSSARHEFALYCGTVTGSRAVKDAVLYMFSWYDTQSTIPGTGITQMGMRNVTGYHAISLANTYDNGTTFHSSPIESRMDSLLVTTDAYVRKIKSHIPPLSNRAGCSWLSSNYSAYNNRYMMFGKDYTSTTYTNTFLYDLTTTWLSTGYSSNNQGSSSIELRDIPRLTSEEGARLSSITGDQLRGSGNRPSGDMIDFSNFI